MPGEFLKSMAWMLGGTAVFTVIDVVSFSFMNYDSWPAGSRELLGYAILLFCLGKFFEELFGDQLISVVGK